MIKGSFHLHHQEIWGLFASFTLQKQQPQQTKALNLEEVQNYNKDEDLQYTVSALIPEEHMEFVASITSVLSFYKMYLIVYCIVCMFRHVCLHSMR